MVELEKQFLATPAIKVLPEQEPRQKLTIILPVRTVSHRIRQRNHPIPKVFLENQKYKREQIALWQFHSYQGTVTREGIVLDLPESADYQYCRERHEQTYLVPHGWQGPVNFVLLKEIPVVVLYQVEWLHDAQEVAETQSGLQGLPKHAHGPLRHV